MGLVIHLRLIVWIRLYMGIEPKKKLGFYEGVNPIISEDVETPYFNREIIVFGNHWIYLLEDQLENLNNNK